MVLRRLRSAALATLLLAFTRPVATGFECSDRLEAYGKRSGAPELSVSHTRVARWIQKAKVQGSRFPVQGSWFPVQGSWFPVQGSWFLVQGSWFLVPGSGFLVQGSGFRVSTEGNSDLFSDGRVGSQNRGRRTSTRPARRSPQGEGGSSQNGAQGLLPCTLTGACDPPKS